MLDENIQFIRKINVPTYFIGTILFLTVIGFIPLFGYTITIAKERIKNGRLVNPPDIDSLYNLTVTGLIGFGILFITLLPSALIYLLMPVLIGQIEVGESVIVTLILLSIALIGVILSLIGLYVFSAVIFMYCRYSVDERLSFKDAVLYTIFQIILSKKYAKSVLAIFIISGLLAIVTELFFLSIILSPFVGTFGLLYFALMGYIIGSLTTEFRTVNDIPINSDDIPDINIQQIKNHINKLE